MKFKLVSMLIVVVLVGCAQPSEPSQTEIDYLVEKEARAVEKQTEHYDDVLKRMDKCIQSASKLQPNQAFGTYDPAGCMSTNDYRTPDYVDDALYKMEQESNDIYKFMRLTSGDSFVYMEREWDDIAPALKNLERAYRRAELEGPFFGDE